MSIEGLFKKNPENTKYASTFRRSSATMVDVTIVLFLRSFVMQFLGNLWLKAEVAQFLLDFKDHFGTETVKHTREHMDFVISHSVFTSCLLFYFIVILVGALYHSLLNASSWHGTIGKRLMKITIVTENDEKITFLKSLSHYFLSVLPFVYVIYIVTFQTINKLTFFHAVTASELNVFFGIIFTLWVQIHIFTRKKTTAYDLICKTVLINDKTLAKFPWTKTQEPLKNHNL